LPIFSLKLPLLNFTAAVSSGYKLCVAFFPTLRIFWLPNFSAASFSVAVFSVVPFTVALFAVNQSKY